MQKVEPNKKQNQVRQRRNLSKVNSLHRHQISRKWLERGWFVAMWLWIRLFPNLAGGDGPRVPA